MNAKRRIQISVILTFLVAGARAWSDGELPTPSGLPPAAYKILERPYDEGKLPSLKIYGLDRVNLVKDKDAGISSENYGSLNGQVTALVKRAPNTGKVMFIEVHLNTSSGRHRRIWSIADQTFTSCGVGATAACKITRIDACKTEDARNDDALVSICPFLAEIILPPKKIVDAGAVPCACSPGPACSCDSSSKPKVPHIVHSKH